MDKTKMIAEIEQTRHYIISLVNTRFDWIVARLESQENVSAGYEAAAHEYTLPITTNPVVFIGKKPIAVIFANERIHAKSWREVLNAVLEHCCQDPVYHGRLMDLRGKAAGKLRMFLSDKPDGMSKPAKIDDSLYVEAHHGAQAMMYMLVSKIFKPIGYDRSNISVVIKS